MEETERQCPGLTGLWNLGNTCYMNAVLQCLCSVPPLVEHFLSGKYKTALCEENGEFATAFGCLMSDMWCGEFDCVSPRDFHSALGKRYPTFSKRTQQDAQEFLICVLSELHEALKKSSRDRHIANAKASRGSVSETSIVTQLFEGQLSYDITCLECKTTTNRPESFTVLSLPIPSKNTCSLQDCLKCFFQQDTLTQNNQIHCSSCGTKQDAEVKGTITKAPQIIIFHLKSPPNFTHYIWDPYSKVKNNSTKELLVTDYSLVQWSGGQTSLRIQVSGASGKAHELGSKFEWQGRHRRKLSTDICYPLSNLDLSPYSSPPFCTEAAYSLCAVVNHCGFLDDGHYTAFCKHSVTKTWYSFDDAQLTSIPDSSVQSNKAYLLFYACQDLPYSQ